MSSKFNMKKLTKKALKYSLPQPVIKKITERRFQAREEKRLKNLVPGSYESCNKYTVVTAVYNVGDYLNDFFEGLKNQTISASAIHVVAVDDGSTDGSDDIIKLWQKRWPDHITYIRKENGGQASARNLGFDYVETEWATFIDPDDFVAPDYFEIVDKAITENPSLKMVACNLIFYLEASGKFSNTHSLNGRFEHGDSFFAVGDERMPIQLSMSAAFFRMSEIRRQRLRIDESIRPNFEDGHFIGKYLTLLNDGTVAFLKGAHYYYRKREDGSSTTDRAWLSKDKYLNIPERGYLDLLKFSASKNEGRPPKNIQDTILYDLSWYLKYLVGHPEKNILADSPAEETQFLNTLSAIFELIDEDAIFAVSGRFMSYNNKLGICTSFKNSEPPYYLCSLRRIDLISHELLVESLSPDTVFYLDGKPVTPRYTKRLDRYLCERLFYSKYEQWIPFHPDNTVLSYRMPNGKEVRLSVNGTHFRGSIPMKKMLARFKSGWEKYPQHGNTWIIMDRDTQADDNGEHFYRYMAANHPEQKCYFVLRKDSPHWARLEKEGFNLLPFGSAEHERELKACSKIISSHADPYVHSYFGDNFLLSKDYVFLQHGVTKDDLSTWLNGKPISLLITATPQEYNAFVADGSPYELTEKQVARTGFPRHDNLLRLKEHYDHSKKMIFIAPTWRKTLVGPKIGKGNERALNPLFGESDYAQAWGSFLKSDELKNIANSTDTRIVFFPHANILPYVEAGLFDVPDYIELGSTELKPIQDYFAEASICITDYSSVAFDVAYLDTPCIYYQFDKEEVFKGGHIYAKGYFSYENDGFGPVAETEESLQKALAAIASNGFEPLPEYQRRIDATFDLRDGKCCERVYEAVMREKPDGEEAHA